MSKLVSLFKQPDLRLRYRKLTSKKRMLPDFIIIGAQREGTTSLYNYLIEHPSVLPAYKKEIHFFDLNFDKGIDWYRAHFSLTRRQTIFKGNKIITGESSPYYLFHPLVPSRTKKLLPNCQFIVLLRNPLDRAYSHYNHEVKRGTETRSFRDAIMNEENLIEEEEIKIIKKRNYSSKLHQNFSYLSRGYYYIQLKRWLDFFPKDKFFFIETNNLKRKPKNILEELYSFLNLSAFDNFDFPIYNKNTYPKIPDQLRKELELYYVEKNEQLYSLINEKYNW
ncbi:MAG: sulfotransferase domain-containing protein [Candidatus Heimdallarchaeaceae archaeon]